MKKNAVDIRCNRCAPWWIPSRAGPFMPMRYFDLSEDVYIPGRWDLGKLVDPQGEDVWSWLLMRGEPAQFEERLKVPIRSPGKPLDFCHAAFGIPVVSARVAAIFSELASKDVQLIPVEVGSQPDGYFLLNVTRVVKCIDDAASEEVQYWTPEDGLPEKVGTYFSVAGMRIDTSKVGDTKVFRTWGWEVALIVSEDINAKTGLVSMEVSGEGLPSPLVTQEDRVAVLLGMESSTLPRHLPTPAGDVRLVTVKALLPAELAWLRKHGKAGQAELARRFAEGSEEHLSRVRRQPVI